MTTKKWHLFLFFFYWATMQSWAQEEPVVYNYTINMKDGLLANNYITGIKDSRGLIWMVSSQGLDRYDGVEIKSYPGKISGFAHDHINHFEEDPNGNFWLACLPYKESKKYQYSIFNPITEEVWSLEDYLKKYSISLSKPIVYICHNNNRFFIQDEKGTVYEFDGKALFKRFKLESPQERIYKIGKRIAFAYDIFIYDAHLSSKIYDFASNPTTVYPLKEQGKDMYYQFLEIDSSDTFYWLSSPLFSSPSSTQLFFFKKNYQKAPELIAEKSFDFSLYLKGSFNNLNHYIGKTNDELYFFDKNGILKTNINILNTSNESSYDFLLKSEPNSLWMRDREKGGIRYIQHTFSPFKKYQLFDKWYGVRGMIKKERKLYIAPIHGPLYTTFKGNLEFKFFDWGAGQLTEMRDGKLLIPYEGPLIGIYDPQKDTIQRYYLKETNHWNTNLMCYEDTLGDIWVGTSSGLFYLDSQKQIVKPYTNYGHYEALKTSKIYFFHPNEDGLWLATSSGLYRWHPQHGIQERFHEEGIQAQHLPYNHICHIHEDKEGVFWLASKGGGLIQFDPKTKQSKQFSSKNGLANDVLYAVYGDNYDHLWMSSNLGIMRFNKKTNHVDSYTSENGLLDNEFNTSSHYKDTAGNIYFGSQLGLITFHPKDFQQKQKTPFPLIITSAIKISKDTSKHQNIWPSLLKNKPIKLNSLDKGFEIKVGLLDYRNPQLHEYAYKIEGFDNEWTHQKNATIYVFNLPYGNYQLRIKVKGLDGDWQEFKKPITIIVLTPFYWQTWFLVGVFFLILFIIYVVFKLRTQQLLQRQKKLEGIVEKRTQKIAKQADDLKALDKIKSRFFANITHELRTPLTLILGPVSKLLHKTTNTKDLNQLNTIKNQGEHLLDLIEEILDLSKLEANKLELVEEKVHLKSFVVLIFEAFQLQAEYHNIDYVLNFNAQDDLYLLLDTNKVEKMLNNLLINAIKFTPAYKTISLTVKEQKETIEFIVQDTGQGIHPEDLPHVIERFYQSKQTNRPAQGGTGIGLALVQEFSEIMKGKVTIESQLDEGTTVSILLPKLSTFISPEEQQVFQINLKQKQQQQLIQPNVPLLQNQDKTILLVEDHSEMRYFIASLLEEEYYVRVAQNGKEGLELMQKHAPEIDLIISDVMMPEMDGFTLLKHIKSNPAWRSIPMIMLTARAAEKDKLHALTLGVDDYLTKPFSIEELSARIQNLIQNSLDRKEWLKAESSTVDKEKKEDIPQQEDLFIVSEEELEWLKTLELTIKKQISNEEISILDLSKTMFMSERHFRRRIKKLTGLSPSNLINEIRMRIARELIDSKQVQSLSQLAYEVGFKAQSSFSRAFKKYYGETPSKYLKK